jgi:hypothetical protein
MTGSNQKGFQYIFFEELRDSELGWIRYKIPKFIDKRRTIGI